MAIGLALAMCAGGCVDRTSSDDATASTSEAGDDRSESTGQPASPWPNCELADRAAAERICAGAPDENACANLNAAPEQCHACVWTDWVPTTLEVDGTCSFGPVEASCAPEILDPNGVGCYAEEIVMYETDAEVTRLLRAPYCQPVTFECRPDGDSDDDPPECACAFDPAFPG